MIARKPKSEAQASRFIAAADKDGAGKRKLVVVSVNFDLDFLDRVDRTAKMMGLNRSAFVINAIAEKLHQLELSNRR